jgi:hypothetical protein
VHVSTRATALHPMLNSRPQRLQQVWKPKFGPGDKTRGLFSRRRQVLLVLGCVLGGLLLLSIVTLVPHKGSHQVLPVKADRQLGSIGKLGVVSSGGKATATAVPLHALQARGQQQQQHLADSHTQQQHPLNPGKQGIPADNSAASSSKGSATDTASSSGRDAKAPAAAGTGSSAAQVQAARAAAQPKDQKLNLAAARNGSTQQQGPGAAAPQQHDVDPADATSVYIQKRGVEPARLKHPVWWMGPLWSGSGYSSGR